MQILSYLKNIWGKFVLIFLQKKCTENFRVFDYTPQYFENTETSEKFRDIRVFEILGGIVENTETSEKFRDIRVFEILGGIVENTETAEKSEFSAFSKYWGV